MLWILPLLVSALANDDGAVFNGFTHTGDGHTPSMMDALEQQQPAVRQGLRIGEEDGRGGWGWSTSVGMPDALLPAAITLAYSSSGGPGLLGEGWSVELGPTITRVGAAEEARLYGAGEAVDLDTDGVVSAWEDAVVHVYRVSGIGPGGLLVPDGLGGFTLVSDTPGVAHVELHPNLVFEVRSGGLRALLEPRLSGMNAPGARARAWRPLITHDASCNVVRVVWDERDRPQEVRAGGNTQGGVMCGMSVAPTTSLETVRGWALVVPETYTYTGRARFVYEDLVEPATHVVRWSEGAAEVIDSRLMAVDVDARRIVGAWYPFGSVEVVYAASSDEPVVTEVLRVGADGVTTQSLATFTRSTWSVEPAVFVPFVVGEAGDVSEMSSRWGAGSITERVSWLDDNPDAGDVFEGIGTSRTFSRGSLQDWNGDGFVDVVTTRAPGDAVSDYGQWLGGTDLLGWATPYLAPFMPGARSFDVIDDLVRYHEAAQDDDGLVVEEGLELRESVDVSDTLSATFTRRVLVDLNGDGRLDLVQSDALPPTPVYDVVSPAMSPGTAAPLGVGGAYTWEVYYGASDGTLAAQPAVVTAPTPWPGVTVSATACTLPTTTTSGPQRDLELATSNPYNPHVVDLMDVNGDGLPDLLAWPSNADWALQATSTSPLRLFVARPLGPDREHQGFVEVDFDVPADALALLNGDRWFERQMSSAWFSDHVDLYQGGGGTADHFPQCLFTQVRQVRDLRDVNNDGLVDFVVSTPTGWDVYAGTGQGFAPATPWLLPSAAPVGLDGLVPLSWTYESGWRPYPDMSLGFESVEPLENVPMEGPMYGGGGQICPMPPTPVNVTPFYYTENMSRQVVGMVDVDQDGRDDLVLSKPVPCTEPVAPADSFQWWRNLGGGFAEAGACSWDPATGFECPEWAWLADGLSVSWSGPPMSHLSDCRVDPLADDCHYVSVTPQASADLARSVSRSASVERKLVRDLNGDGAIDVVLFEPTEASGHLVHASVAWGTWSPPGLVLEVADGAGVTTQLAWAPASEMAPRGDVDEEQHSNSGASVLVALTAEDTVTGAVQRTTWSRRDEICLGGVCPGYAQVTMTQDEPRLSYAGGRLHPELDPSGEVRWYERVRVTTTSALQGAALREVQTVWLTDHQLPLAPELGGQGSQMLPRYEVSKVWEDLQGGACGVLEACRVVSRTVTTHNEQLVATAPEAMTLTSWFGYDADHGLLTSVVTQGGGWSPESGPGTAVDAPVEVAVTWSVNPTMGIAVPTQRTTLGWDDALGSDATLESLSWAYDGQAMGSGSPPTQGLMTRQEVCGDARTASVGGPCAAPVVWTFDRHVRGMVEGIDGPKGSDVAVSAFRFGGVVRGIEVNGVGHETRRQVNDRGQVSTVLDPNGVRRRYVFDTFGREVAVYVQGVGGVELLEADTTYVDTVPRGVLRRTFLEGGAAASETYEVYNGFGDLRQTWRRDALGHWLVSDVLVDAFGDERGTTATHTVPTFTGTTTAGVASASGSALLAWSVYDASGAARVSWDDVTASPSCMTRTWVPSPGTTETRTASGRGTALVHDALGRLVQVREGTVVPSAGEPCVAGPFSPALLETARYRYDGQGKLQAFADAPDLVVGTARNRWRYGYDTAGRLAQVWRSHGVTGPGPWMPYYAYAYEDGAPVSMWEGLPAGTPAVTWAWDNLGRLVQKTVQGPPSSLSAPEVYTWTWDTLWKGSKSTATSPVETTSWFYTPMNPTQGGLGAVSLTTRSFVDRSDTLALATTTDLTGRVTSTVYPSGARVDTVYTGAWATSQVVYADATSSALVDSFDLTYDGYGELSGWSATVSSQSWWSTRQRPYEVSELGWQSGGDVYAMGLSYGAEHRLVGKELSGALKGLVGPSTLTYGYDKQGRLGTLTSTGCTTAGCPTGPSDVHAVYTWDVAGRPVSQEVWTGTGRETWLYDTLLPYGEVTGRVASLGGVMTHEEHVHDAVTGRTTQVARYTVDPLLPDALSTYEYDGTGQLAWAWSSEGVTLTGVRYHHDLSDELVERVRYVAGNPEREYGFGPWQQEFPVGGSAVVVERVLPWLELRWSAPGVSPRYVFRDTDGHGVVELDAAGAPTGARLLGAFGAPLGVSHGSPSAWNGLHGSELEPEVGLARMGVRHMRPGDGLWLQPEPLLGLGLPAGMLASPRSVVGVYAAGEPVGMEDRSGRNPVLLGKAAVRAVVGEAVDQFAEGALMAGGTALCGPQCGEAAVAVKQVSDLLSLDVKSAAKGASTLVGMARKALTGVDEAADMARAVDHAAGACFTANTQVLTPNGPTAISTLEVRDLVLASTEPSGARVPAPVTLDLPGWFDRVCAAVRRVARTALVPAAVMGVCDIHPVAAASDLVEVYEARSGTWTPSVAGAVEDGAYLHEGHLFEVVDGVAEHVGDASDVAWADVAHTEAASAPALTGSSWVVSDGHHVRAGDVPDGASFFYGGRAYEVDGGVAVATERVVGRVKNTFVRAADAVVDLEVGHDVLTGTPNHPFWAPSVRDFVALEDLAVGTVLRTYGGSEATALGLTFRKGDVEVYDIEVEGLHNFFVRGEGGDALGVLVHNSTGGQQIYRGMREGADGAPMAGPTARTLGARPGTDIPVDADGMVHPGTGGMSVAPSPGALPGHRKPPELGGTGKDPVWGMSTDDLGPDLQYVPDSPTHGTVQPSRSMTEGEYQQALCSTGDCWGKQ